MRTCDIFYPSTNGTDTIVAKIWQPDGAAKGIIQISHGMCEYIDRYSAFAQTLTQQGFFVCANNHLGHGASASDPEHLGYFAKRGGDKFLIDDLHTLTNMMKIKFPGMPLVLFGHSMGSFIARNYVTKYGQELDAVIFCGTSGPNPGARVGKKLAAFECRRRGEFYRSSLLSQLAFGSYNKKYKRRTKFDWLTRDEDVVDAYLADPYCNFTFTASAFHDLFTLLLRCSDPEWFASYPKALPTLLISGDMDPVGDYGKGVSYVYQTLVSAGVRDIHLKLYKGARHELLNETNFGEVYEDILCWLSHLPAFSSEDLKENSLDAN